MGITARQLSSFCFPAAGEMGNGARSPNIAPRTAQAFRARGYSYGRLDALPACERRDSRDAGGLAVDRGDPGPLSGRVRGLQHRCAGRAIPYLVVNHLWAEIPWLAQGDPSVAAEQTLFAADVSLFVAGD